MAWHMKLSLPKFKVTQIGDSKIHRDLPRGRKATGSIPAASFPPGGVAEDEEDETHINLDSPDPQPCENSEAGPNVSLHAIKQKASVSAWDQVRATLQKAVVESSALPSDQGCVLCAAPATHCCTECAAWAYYCSCSSTLSGEFLPCW